MTQTTNQFKLLAWPYAPTKFFLQAVSAHLQFVRGASGSVESVTLHPGGR